MVLLTLNTDKSVVQLARAWRWVCTVRNVTGSSLVLLYEFFWTMYMFLFLILSIMSIPHLFITYLYGGNKEQTYKTAYNIKINQNGKLIPIMLLTRIIRYPLVLL